MGSWIGTVLFVVGLVVAIAVHEWGHFVTARWFGMRADRFFVGFGPTAWSFRHGETEYGVKWIPFGGFVRIAGMSDGDERQRPVAEVVFDRETVAADRRAAAGDRDFLPSGARRVGPDDGARATARAIPLHEVPAVPEETWRRLEHELDRRGVVHEDRVFLVDHTRALAGVDGSATEAAAHFERLAAERLEEGGIRGVRHRVLRGDEQRFFRDRPVWQRTVVLASGAGMHFVQAFVLVFVAFWAFGAQPVPTVQSVLVGSPAAEAGLQPGDRIVAVEGQPVDDFGEARSLIGDRTGEPLTLTVVRDGVERQLRLTTSLVAGPFEIGSPLDEAGLLPSDRILSIGGRPVTSPEDVRAVEVGGEMVTVTVERVGPSTDEVATLELTVPVDELDLLAEILRGQAGFVPAQAGYGPIEALEETFVGPRGVPSMVTGTFAGFAELFGPDGIGQIPAQLSGAERDPAGASFVSPIGLAQVAGQATQAQGFFFLLLFLAVINVFVGIFNLVPLPPLDGGHLAVLAVERSVNAVRRLRGQEPDWSVDPRAIAAIAVPVLVLLGTLFVAVLVLDITNPLQLPQ